MKTGRFGALIAFGIGCVGTGLAMPIEHNLFGTLLIIIGVATVGRPARAVSNRPSGVPQRPPREESRPVSASAGPGHVDPFGAGDVSDDGGLCRVRAER